MFNMFEILAHDIIKPNYLGFSHVSHTYIYNQSASTLEMGST